MPDIILNLLILLFSVICHEFAHGWMAVKEGDPTPEISGRLTFNPLAHLDPIGTILLPIICYIANAPIFGWARPVPVNPLNFHNFRFGLIKVAVSGPFANLLLAAIASAINFIMKNYSILPFELTIFFTEILRWTILLNIILAVFNLLPIPPLDGSRVVSGILPPNLAMKYEQITPFGIFILFLLISSGFFSKFLWPIVSYIYKLFV